MKRGKRTPLLFEPNAMLDYPQGRPLFDMNINPWPRSEAVRELDSLLYKIKLLLEK